MSKKRMRMSDYLWGKGFDQRVGHGATQNDPRILEHLWPPVLWNAARSLSMAARDVLDVKIPAEASPVV
jgi:hypothetical protein